MTGMLLRCTSRVITPSSPGRLAGYAARGRQESSGTHDELEACLVWLEDARGCGVLWLAIDAIGVTNELVERIVATLRRATGCSDLAVVVCASHTHSAPLGWTGSIHPGHPGGVSEHSVAELLRALADAGAELAARPAERVAVTFDTVEVDGVATNRLDPEGPHDRSAGVLVARRADQSVAAVVVDFAAHPTVLPAANLEWSADWPGAMRRAVIAALGTHPTVAFLQGAAGDVSTRFTRTAQSFDEADRLGEVLARAVLGIIGSGGTPVRESVGTYHGSATLSVRSLPGAQAAQAAVLRAEARVAAAGGDPADPSMRILQTELDGARVQRDLAVASLPAQMTLGLDVVSMDSLAWLHVPVELFASLGERIAAASPFATTRVVGYTNGYLGYVADRGAHAAGSYEALSSYFSPESADRLVAAAVDLLGAAHESVLQETTQ